MPLRRRYCFGVIPIDRLKNRVKYDGSLKPRPAATSAIDLSVYASSRRAASSTRSWIRWSAFEPLVSRRLAETVAREAGVTTAVLDPLEGLTREQVEAGADYFSVMRENLAALRTALGCT